MARLPRIVNSRPPPTISPNVETGAAESSLMKETTRYTLRSSERGGAEVRDRNPVLLDSHRGTERLGVMSLVIDDAFLYVRNSS